jgi:hypothetical protein
MANQLSFEMILKIFQIFFYITAPTISFLIFLVAYKNLKKIHSQIQTANLREYCKSYREILVQLPMDMFKEKITDDFIPKNKEILLVCNYFGLLFEEFRLHEDGHIDDKTWKDWEGNIDRHALNPGYVKAWYKAKTVFDFDQSFASFIEGKFKSERF